ncbi:UNVERIFIED_CONTAM: hypothetical protein Slati_0171900 [Sesamum latifolium]|uniref:Uncharacterized protein n=1 Tax=Sesamum latifolium TaxID=2727402 RepID=A0AAW2YAR4_9LAMI
MRGCFPPSFLGSLYVKNSYPAARGCPLCLLARQWQKLEDKADHLNADVARLKEEKKELVARAQQQEKELKKLKKEVAGHEEAIRKAVEKAELDFPNSEGWSVFSEGVLG